MNSRELHAQGLIGSTRMGFSNSTHKQPITTLVTEGNHHPPHHVARARGEAMWHGHR